MLVHEQSAEGVTSRVDAMLAGQQSKAEAFRSWHIRGNPIVLFNAWDAGSAKAIAAGGSKAIATSSWAVANANGFSDGERTPLALAIDNLRRITGAVDVPVTVDLESGYGDTAEIVGTTIRLSIEAGAIGCNLEDSFPVNGKLRNMGDHADRLRQARRVADQTTIGFFINARTDVFLQRLPEQHDQSMVQEAIERARAYAQAGADGLFAPGLTNISLIGRLAAESPLPLNVMVVETTPSLHVLAEQGVARISYGPRSYLLIMKALENAARAITI